MGKSTEGLAVWDTCQAGLSTKWTAEGYFSFHNFNLEFKKKLGLKGRPSRFWIVTYFLSLLRSLIISSLSFPHTHIQC